MIKKDENPDFLNDYIFYLSITKGRSKRTVEEYYTDIRMFLRYLIYIRTPDDDIKYNEIPIKKLTVSDLNAVTLKQIYEYTYFLREERANSGKAIARKVSALKGLFKYFHKQMHLIDNDPTADLELPSYQKSLPKYLSLNESLELLNISASVESSDEKRDYCILTLFLNCGMRLSELVGLNINDINFNEKTMRLLGKGNKERIIYINDACVVALKDYISERENPANEPNALFLSRNKKRISKRRVQQIVEKSLSNAGLQNRGLSTHKLRHTAATLMYQHGNVDTLTLKEILGHKSISTTEIYTHLSSEILKNAADSSPLAHVTNKKKEED